MEMNFNQTQNETGRLNSFLKETIENVCVHCTPVCVTRLKNTFNFCRVLFFCGVCKTQEYELPKLRACRRRFWTQYGPKYD